MFLIFSAVLGWTIGCLGHRAGLPLWQIMLLDLAVWAPAAFANFTKMEKIVDLQAKLSKK